ncbi:unnamed protein product [Rhizoctonia solani]|uniref:BTB domain-containing protein n=1 Tax=Rhizoctonia solani TaxID=456999 RepID=A0A8H3CWF4_9AGAM|nr:unnamed protein product [Rhizoctonia solani]
MSADKTSNTPPKRSESESEPQTETEVFETSHFYNDGNITLDVKGAIFKVHKSILTLHSEVFKDMFGLVCARPTGESQDESIQLDDDPKVFHIAMDAVYKGLEFAYKADIILIMDTIAIAHKYQMAKIEGCLQGHISESMLPTNGSHAVSGSRFKLYDEHPGLAMVVLRLGDSSLTPWAFYRVGVELFSKISIDDTSTYGPPPTWFAFDPDFTYSLLVLQRIINDTFENWQTKISDFHGTACSRTFKSGSTTIKCARRAGRFGPYSSLYIAFNKECIDLVSEIASRLVCLDALLTGQKDDVYSGWCLTCSTSIKSIISKVIDDMYLHLKDCVTRMDRMKLRNLPNI